MWAACILQHTAACSFTRYSATRSCRTVVPRRTSTSNKSSYAFQWHVQQLLTRKHARFAKPQTADKYTSLALYLEGDISALKTKKKVKLKTNTFSKQETRPPSIGSRPIRRSSSSSSPTAVFKSNSDLGKYVATSIEEEHFTAPQIRRLAATQVQSVCWACKCLLTTRLRSALLLNRFFSVLEFFFFFF